MPLTASSLLNDIAALVAASTSPSNLPENAPNAHQEITPEPPSQLSKDDITSTFANLKKIAEEDAKKLESSSYALRSQIEEAEGLAKKLGSLLEGHS